MCQLFETIKLIDGIPQNLDYHFNRVNKSRMALFGETSIKDFDQFFENFEFIQKGLFKLKIIYSNKIEKYELSPYSIRTKSKVKFFEITNLNYSFKFLNRKQLQTIELNLNSDEIGVITQNGFLTDATYANIVLFDGHNQFTPQNCLLEGTKRQKLLDSHFIVPKIIHLNELAKYQYIQLINSMIDLEDNVILEL